MASTSWGGTKTSVNRNNVPLTVSVVNSRQIEASSESALLPVLSSQIPGVFITERGITGFGVSTGSAGSISIRGVGGSPNTDVLVLLNGVPQYMGIMGHPLPDAYIASDVERVEVIRGPASTLYGSNAMGGVINIITKEQDNEGYSARFRTMLGSYNTQKYMANAGLKRKDFDILVSFNHDHTDGHRDSSDFTINNGYIDAGYKMGEHYSIAATSSLAGFKAQDPGMEGGLAGEAIDIVRGMVSAALNNQFAMTSGSARFFYNFGEHNITDGFHSKDNNFGAVIYQSVYPLNGNTVTAGIDYKKYGGIAENLKAMNGEGMVFGDTTISELAGYLNVQQLLWNKLTFNAGFRLDHNSVYGNEPVYSTGLAWHLSGTSTLKASLSKGFRSPTIRELYLWGTANEALKPERMISYEAGFLQRLFKQKLSIEITVYKEQGDNMIIATTESGITKYRNSGSFSNMGLEFSGIYNPCAGLAFQTTYSYISMDEPILATPEHHLNMSVNYIWSHLITTVSLESVRNLYTLVTPEIQKQSYTLLDVRMAYQLGKYTDVFLKGENITNEKYEINFGYPMPGFIIYGGINLSLSGDF